MQGLLESVFAEKLSLRAMGLLKLLRIVPRMFMR
jgi:hypothetical protein